MQRRQREDRDQSSNKVKNCIGHVPASHVHWRTVANEPLRMDNDDYLLQRYPRLSWRVAVSLFCFFIGWTWCPREFMASCFPRYWISEFPGSRLKSWFQIHFRRWSQILDFFLNSLKESKNYISLKRIKCILLSFN